MHAKRSGATIPHPPNASQKSGSTYPKIVRPKYGPIAMIVASFPISCPCCHALRLSISGESTAARTATYACGGVYSPSELCSSNKNAWEGCCGERAS